MMLGMKDAYIFVRGGAVVCTRDTLIEALEYGRRSLGWDIHIGQKSRTYRVEKHIWDSDSRTWKYLGEEWNIPDTDAVDPFPDRSKVPLGVDPNVASWLLR